MIRARLISIAFAAALSSACTTAPTFQHKVPETGMQAPEAASGYAEKAGVVSKKFMVAAASPLATDAGYQILKAGGSAIDAAIATQMVLTLVEPQSR